MVKIPKFDDLKKMGSDLLDSAKTGKFGGVVDKLKSGIDTFSTKKTAVEDESLNKVLTGMQEALSELNEIERVQALVIKKMQGQLNDLANVLQSYEKVNQTNTPTDIKNESPKSPPTDENKG